jgi:hypothetical protein
MVAPHDRQSDPSAESPGCGGVSSFLSPQSAARPGTDHDLPTSTLAYFIGADFAPSGTPLLAAEHVGEAQCPPVAGAQVKLQGGFRLRAVPGRPRPNRAAPVRRSPPPPGRHRRSRCRRRAAPGRGGGSQAGRWRDAELFAVLGVVHLADEVERRPEVAFAQLRHRDIFPRMLSGLPDLRWISRFAPVRLNHDVARPHHPDPPLPDIFDLAP